jgi:hypothetical protein
VIDFGRWRLPESYTEAILNHPHLDWKGRYHVKTGERVRGNEAYILNQQGQRIFKLILKEPEGKNGFIQMEGSLHHISEGKKNNSTRLNIASLKNAIEILADYLQFDPKHAVLSCIEYGANVKLAEPPTAFMDGMIMHASEPFKHEKEEGKDFYRCRHEEYFLKVYDKALQFSRSENLIRIEKRTRKMNHVQRYGILTLADLLDRKKLIHLARDLVRTFKGVVYFDPIVNIDELDTQTQVYLLKYSQFKYWQKITNPNTRKTTLQRFRKKVNELAQRNLILEISSFLQDELNLLFKEQKVCTAFNPLHICKKVYSEKEDDTPQNEQLEIPTCTPIDIPIEVSKRVQPRNDERDLTTFEADIPQQTQSKPFDKATFLREKVGNHNHITEDGLIQALQSNGQPDNLLKSLLVNGLAVTTPLSDGVPRYYLAGSTPF